MKIAVVDDERPARKELISTVIFVVVLVVLLIANFRKKPEKD